MDMTWKWEVDRQLQELRDRIGTADFNDLVGRLSTVEARSEVYGRKLDWVNRFRELVEQRTTKLEVDLNEVLGRLRKLERGEFDVPALTMNAQIPKDVPDEFSAPIGGLRPPKPGETPGSVIPDDARPQPIWMTDHEIEMIERVPKTVDGEDDFRPYPATDLADTVVLDRSRKLEKVEAAQELDPLKPVTPKEAYHRGLNAGAKEALRQAEVRVVDYMSQHFSQATIDGVVGALKGTKGWFNG